MAPAFPEGGSHEGTMIEINKFYGTVEFLGGQRAAILTITDHAGEWAGSGRIEVRPSFTGGVRAALYEEAYRQASINAQSKGGRLERFSRVG